MPIATIEDLITQVQVLDTNTTALLAAVNTARLGLVAALGTSNTNAINSAASALAASISAASTLSSLNAFRSAYYGPLGADPLTDPIGGEMTAGDLYFNTISLEMMVYRSNSWISYESTAIASASASLASELAAATSATSASTSATAADVSEAAALASQTAAATSATSASTSATAADVSEAAALVSQLASASSATAAAASASVLYTSEVAALASQTAAATSATSASTSATAADVSEAAAFASEFAALASENAASTSATGADVSEAAALASQTAAATSATSASTQAGTSTAQAVISTDKATLATTQATAAAASATAAAASAAEAQALATGALTYQGGWDASTLTFPASGLGYYYKVTVAGGDYAVGDSVIYNGTTWDKIDNTEQVTSVAGRVGAVVLAKADVGLASVDNTPDVNKPVSTAQALADTAVLNAAASDATTKANAAATASVPAAHAGVGGAVHASVVAGGLAGFMTGADKTRLDGLVINSTVQAYSSVLATWAGVTPGAGVAAALAIAVGSAGAFLTQGAAAAVTTLSVGGYVSPASAAVVSGTAQTFSLTADPAANKGIFTVDSSSTVQLLVGSIPAGPLGMWVQTKDRSGTATFPLLLNPGGGVVGIGVATALTQCHIQGAYTANRGVVQIDDTSAQAAGTGGGVSLGGKFTDAGAITPGAYIRAAKANATTGNYTFDTVFLNYRNGDANPTERMRISGLEGNVGIGRAPTTRLDIFGSNQVVGIIQDGGVAGNSELLLTAAGGANYTAVNMLGGYIYGRTDGGAVLHIGPNTTIASATAKFNTSTGVVTIPVSLGVGGTAAYPFHAQNNTDVTFAYFGVNANAGGSASAVIFNDDRGFSGINSGNTVLIRVRNDGLNDTGAILSCETIGGSASTRFRVGIDGTVTMGGIAVGYLGIPQNSQSAAYTLVLADAGKHILHPSADTVARTFTIPANGAVAYPVGTAISFVNQVSAGSLKIAITTDTMRLAGAGTTGSRTLAANGIATAVKMTATEWLISGTGLT